MKQNIFYILVLSSFSLQNIIAQNNESQTDSTITVMMTDKELPAPQGLLFTIPGKGLFLADGNTFYSLDENRCPEWEKLRFKYNIPIEQIVISDGKFLIKSQSFVIQINQTETQIVTELDTDEFAIFCGRNNYFNVAMPEEDGSWGWYRCNFDNQQMDCVLRMNESIDNIIEIGEHSLCITPNNIYIISNGECSLLTTIEEGIVDATLTSQGLMFCTPSSLCLWDGSEEIQQLNNINIHSIFADNNIIYLLTMDGHILKTRF